MAITFNEIAELVARFGNSVVNEEANMAATTIGKNVIKKEKQSGTVGIVNVKAGGIGSTRFIADGGNLPEGANKDITQLAYHPKAIFSRLSVPRISALTCVSKADGVNLVKEQMQTAGEDLGRTLGRALFGTTLGAITTPGAPAAGTFGANGIATVRVADLSGYRIGAAIEGLQDSGAPPVDLFGVVTDINWVTGDVTLQLYIDAAHTTPAADTGVPATTNATSPVLPLPAPRMQGSTATGVDAMCSLTDAASSVLAAGSLGTAGNYSDVATAGGDYTGNDNPGAVALTVGAMDSLSARIQRRRGLGWTHLIMNSLTLQEYLNLLVTNRRFTTRDATSSPDPATSMYQGKPVIVDENINDKTMLFFNDKDVKLAEWRSFGPDSDGKDAAMVSDSKFVYDTQMFGMYNLRITRRNGLGVLAIS